jgi:hypothetical protein
MTNLDSTWQASVVKLAQSGNSRAIAFWLNRYLVPQGICAQVETEPSGCLVIRVACRQIPEGDRLVRFICHRLCKLDSQTIRQVRITAQLVGSPQILWEKAARIIPPSERQNQKAANNVYAFPQPVQPTATPVAASAAVANVEKDQSQPMSNSSEGGFHIPKLRFGSRSGWIDFHAWQSGVQQKCSALQTTALDLTDRSIRWFIQQKPSSRALMLGGSAVAAFLIGCSFELVGYYANPSAFQRSKATFTRMLRSGSVLTGSVKTASERIAVIRQPVLNPDDPTVSLIFSNSTTLQRLPVNHLTAALPASPVPLATTIESYRIADMTVTNLNNPFSSSPSSQQNREATEQKPLSNTSEEDAKGENLEDNPEDYSVAPADKMVLTGLPEDDATDSLTSDSEVERARYASEDPEASESDSDESTTQDSSQKKKVNPLMPQELLANGVDVVNVASNAVVTGGVEQLTQTLSLLQQNGIHAVGAGQDLPSARRPQIFDVKGQRIAYLGYSDSSTRPVSAGNAGVNVSVSQQMEEDIKAIRDQVDWIVVNLNWNRGLRAYPEEWQVKLAHAAIDQGADLVVGYDASVTQGAEIYNGRPIVYSLGSSVDEYNDKPAGNYDTVALKVTLKDHMMELEFLPIQVRRGQAEIAKGELQKTILQYIEQASSLFDHPLHSSTSLNSQLRLSLPSAPDAEMPTDPFISYPESPATTDADPKASPR